VTVDDGPTRVIILGGTGEIGRNMLVFEKAGRLLVVDAGFSFPTDDMPGVDLVLPDFTYVEERAEACEGVILTHGHEDHVGALSWLLPRVPVPVYGTPLTLGLANRRLQEFEINADMREISAPGELELGPFKCSFIAVSHSIPDAVSVAIETADGRILYTSDFKIDENPIDGRHTDLERLGALGDAGVDLMLADSTNSIRKGRTPSEAIVGDALRQIFDGAERRIVVACFASNLHRIQQVCERAEETGRRVAFVGRSMVANVEVARELGHIDVKDTTILPVEDIDRIPPDQTVILCTGSQGEPLSALALIASGEHKFVKLHPHDTVVLSATPIPGNETAVHRVINGLYRIGAEVFTTDDLPVHVSGHAAADELAQMLRTVRPRHLVPVHGEYRQLAHHARIAREVGMDESAIFIVEDGDVLEVENRRVGQGERIEAGLVLVDGLGVGDVGPVVLRDRRVLAGDGIVVCVVTIDAQHGEIVAGPDIITRGFVFEDMSRDLLDEAAERVEDALDALESHEVVEWGSVKKACRRALGEFVWKRTRRRPMILPIVVEI
jgi:ribonuclease J